MGILILLSILVASFSVASAADGNFYKINFKKPSEFIIQLLSVLKLQYCTAVQYATARFC